MNIELLKKLGNMDQIAGIRETQILRGKGRGIRLAEVYNAAGLRFTVMPDQCMDLYDLSYKGMNLCFQSKTGLVAPEAFSVLEEEFTEQWPGGAMVTCGLDNAGDAVVGEEIFPVHGRISSVSAQHFGTDARWVGDDYELTCTGQMHQSKLFGRHLTLRRTVRTGLNDASLEIRDEITNMEAEAEPYLLLYHINFGYPLLQPDSRVAVSGNMSTEPVTALATGFDTMHEPVDGCDEELYLHTVSAGDTAAAVLYNRRLGIGAYVRFDTAALPGLLQWKRMKSHDYVLALEPCNTYGCNRAQLQEQGRLPILPPYSTVTTRVCIGILEGDAQIDAFLEGLK